MSPAAPPSVPPVELATPHIRLHGEVSEPMLAAFLDGLAAAEGGEGPLVLELTTNGGDADVGQRIATDLRLFRERTGRETHVFGKAVVYSAGITVMSGAPRDQRWLARGTMLLVHGRRFARKLDLSGPLAREKAELLALLAEAEAGLVQERWAFEALIAGSEVGMDELQRRAETNWYLDAEEAVRRGLVAAVL